MAPSRQVLWRLLASPLNLHPVLVILGAIAGEILAGVIGLLLSCSAFRKLDDLPPWEAPVGAPAPQPQ